MSDTVKAITIIGATGSVGQSTLAVIDEAKHKFKVEGLAAGRDWQALARLARSYKPSCVAIHDPTAYEPLKDALSGLPIEVIAGEAAVCALAARRCDMVVAAAVGAAGIPSTLAALEAGNHVALANKESLVCASGLLHHAAKIANVNILPLDSEHNAVFQALQSGQDVEAITITASGGPLLNTPIDDLANVTAATAMKHPKWAMGPKISIDSATMMNKALELAEAAYLFDLPHEQVKILIHQQAIVHGMAHFYDGTTMAHLAEPDMRVPIAHALAWPERIKISVPRLDLAKAGALEFLEVDPLRFPAIGLMRFALDIGPAGPIVFNAANEIAVSLFLNGACRFTDIFRCVANTLETFNFSPHARMYSSFLSLEEISEIDNQARANSARFLSE